MNVFWLLRSFSFSTQKDPMTDFRNALKAMRLIATSLSSLAQEHFTAELMEELGQSENLQEATGLLAQRLTENGNFGFTFEKAGPNDFGGSFIFLTVPLVMGKNKVTAGATFNFSFFYWENIKQLNAKDFELVIVKADDEVEEVLVFDEEREEGKNFWYYPDRMNMGNRFLVMSLLSALQEGELFDDESKEVFKLTNNRLKTTGA